MAQNSEKIAKPRGKGRPFKKGEVANPGGRPKKKKDLTRRCRQYIDTAGLERLIFIAQYGKNGESIDALQILLSYAYGRPTSQDKLELAGAVSTSITLKWAGNPA